MQTKINLEQADSNIVYIRPVAVSELPKEIREQAQGIDTLYSVHQANGAPIALVPNRRAAEALARDNDLTPMSVH